MIDKTCYWARPFQSENHICYFTHGMPSCEGCEKYCTQDIVDRLVRKIYEDYVAEISPEEVAEAIVSFDI